MSIFGGPKKDIPVNPAMVHHTHNEGEAFKGHAVPGNIARDGAPKNHRPVEVHSGMLSRNRNTGAFDWGGHGASYDADPTNPLNSGPPRGKTFAPVPPSPGMRNRAADDLASADPGAAHRGFEAAKDTYVKETADLAKKIMNEAGDMLRADDRRALGIGTLPPATTEE